MIPILVEGLSVQIQVSLHKSHRLTTTGTGVLQPALQAKMRIQDGLFIDKALC